MEASSPAVPGSCAGARCAALDPGPRISFPPVGSQLFLGVGQQGDCRSPPGGRGEAVEASGPGLGLERGPRLPPMEGLQDGSTRGPGNFRKDSGPLLSSGLCLWEPLGPGALGPSHPPSNGFSLAPQQRAGSLESPRTFKGQLTVAGPAPSPTRREPTGEPPSAEQLLPRGRRGEVRHLLTQEAPGTGGQRPPGPMGADPHPLPGPPWSSRLPCGQVGKLGGGGRRSGEPPALPSAVASQSTEHSDPEPSSGLRAAGARSGALLCAEAAPGAPLQSWGQEAGPDHPPARTLMLLPAARGCLPCSRPHASQERPGWLGHGREPGLSIYLELAHTPCPGPGPVPQERPPPPALPLLSEPCLVLPPVLELRAHAVVVPECGEPSITPGPRATVHFSRDLNQGLSPIQRVLLTWAPPPMSEQAGEQRLGGQQARPKVAHAEGGPGPQEKQRLTQAPWEAGSAGPQLHLGAAGPFPGSSGATTSPRARPKPPPHPALPLPGTWLPSSHVTPFRSRATALHFRPGGRLSAVARRLRPEAPTLSPASLPPRGPLALATSSIGPQAGRFPAPRRPRPRGPVSPGLHSQRGAALGDPAGGRCPGGRSRRDGRGPRAPVRLPPVPPALEFHQRGLRQGVGGRRGRPLPYLLQEGSWGPEEEAAEQGGQQSSFRSRCRGAAGAPEPGRSVRTEAEDQSSCPAHLLAVSVDRPALGA
ncbi:basic proline-rich protein-like [Moschus berezovskii]|uniref:basic proline-rich protein-like n=1 Tax=Moschus berezovskii TaxID=68408 RepID=UPI0024444530|nr:basic proline-rich protein-like [Moschus berezovskii]